MTPHQLPTERSGRLGTNARQFRDLVATARRALHAGRAERAAIASQQAATFAWFNHPGLFADPELEFVLWGLGDRLRSTGSGQPTADRRRTVLHVATQVYPTGGHTQMLARWLNDDPQSDHRIVTVRQGSTPCPQKVIELAGEPPMALDRLSGTLMGRAQLLREQAEAADFVVVHAHPDDVVPAIALAGISTDTVYINHADHVFWAGSSVPNLVMHLRLSGQALSFERRQISTERSVIMNRPLQLAGEDSDRALTRRRLGVGDDQVLIVTAASASKYEPLNGHSLVRLLEECVQLQSNLVVRAAGPRPEGAWAEAAGRTGGRLVALGPQDDVQPLFAAADVYVDSFPFSSLTSLLEAGSHGLPVLSFRGHDRQCAVLGADSPLVDDFIGYPQSPGQFVEELLELAREHGLRRQRGSALRRSIESSHAHSWGSDLEQLYTVAGSVHPRRPVPEPVQGHTGVLDQAVCALQERTGYALGPLAARRSTLGVLPASVRWATWLSLSEAGLAPRWAELCSDRWRIRGELAAAWLRARGRERATSGN